MKLILDYFYSFKTDGINKDNIGKVFMAADFLGMNHLVEYFKKEISEENAVELFRVSYTLDNLSFARTCVTQFKDLERIKEFSSFSSSMIVFIINCILNKTNWMEFESIDCWDLIWRWSKANTNVEPNDLALERVLDVLNEMRKHGVFCRFDAEVYKEILDNVVESFSDSQSRSRVLQLLNEHRMEGDTVPQKSSSFVLSSKNRSIQRRIIIELSKFIIKSERNVVVAGEGIIWKGSKDISIKFGNSSVSWNLLYRASEHGFSSSSFHSLCDNKGPTITLVKSKNGRICAAYNCGSWKSGGSYFPNVNGFICSIVDSNGGIDLHKFSNFKPDCHTLNSAVDGPTFGNTDLHISNACNSNSEFCSFLGKCFRGAGASDTCLFGSTARETFKWKNMRFMGYLLSNTKKDH